MYSAFKWGVLVVALAVVQSSIVPHYLMTAFKPDLLLLLMVYLALRAPLPASLPAAYGLGLLKDCLGGMYLGLHAFSFLAAYLVLKSLSDRLYVQSSLLFVMTVSATTFGVMVLNFVLLVLFAQTPGLLASLLTNLVPHILINSFCASLVAAMPSFSRPWAASK